MEQMSVAGGTGRGGAGRWALAACALVGLVAVAVVAWPQAVAAGRGLVEARPLLIGVALGVQALAVLAAAASYRVAARATGAELDGRTALEASLGASALSRLLPAGGAVGVWYATRRLRAGGMDRLTAPAAALLVGVATMAVLPLVVAVGAVAAAVQGAVGWAPALGSAAVAATVTTGLGLAAMALRRGDTPPTPTAVPAAVGAAADGVAVGPGAAVGRGVARRSVAPSAAGIVGRALARGGVDREALRGVLSVAGRRRAVLGMGGAAVRYWLVDAAVLWLVFAAFGVVLHPGLVVLGTGAANLATALPITPGGLGMAEAGMGAAFVSLGVPTGLAVVAVLAYRLLSLWLPALVALAVCTRSPQVTA